MAIAALGGLVGQAVVKKSSYLQDQIAWEATIKTALRKLNAALLPFQVMLERAKKVELNLGQNPRLGKWIWQLRDAVEEAEDVLDEMEHYRLEHQVLKRDAKEKAC